MAQRDIQLKIDATVDSADAAKSLGQLRRTLLEIEQLQSQIGDQSSENFQKLQQAAQQTTARMAAVRDSVGDIQDRVRTLEGTQVERLTGSFGLLQEGIMNVDFDKLKIGLQGLGDIGSEKLQSIKQGLTDFGQGIKDNFSSLGNKETYQGLNDGLKGVGDNLKGVGGRASEMFSNFTKAPIASISGGLKGLATGFGGLTKSIITNTIALLSNPLFLAAVVIGAIVVAIVALIAKFGLLTKAIEIMGKAFEFVTALFEAFTDMLGLTTNAQNKFAEDTKVAEEKRRREIEKTLAKQEEIYSRTKGMTQDEIAAIYGKEEAERIVSSNIYDQRIKSEQQTRESINREIKALDGIVKAGGKLTDDQKKRREELSESYVSSVEKEKQAELDKKQTILQLTSDTQNQLERWRIKNIQDQDERRRKEIQMEKEDQLRKIETQLVIARGLGLTDVITQLEETKKEINTYYKNEEVKINDQKNQRIATANKAAADKEKQRLQENLKDLEHAEDQKIKKTEEGTQERFNAEISKFEVLKKFYEDNANVFGKEGQRMVTQLQDQIDATKQKAADANQDILNRQMTTQTELAVLREEGALSEVEIENLKNVELTKLDEARIAAIEIARNIELKNTKLTEDERKVIVQRAENEILNIKKSRMSQTEAAEKNLTQILEDIENDRKERENTRKEEARQKQVEEIQKQLEDENLTYEKRVELLQKLSQLRIQAINDEKQKELDAIEETRQARIKAAEGNAEVIKQINEEADAARSDADSRYGEEVVQTTTETNEQVQAIEKNTTDILSAEQERRARKFVDQAKEILMVSTNLANAVFGIQELFGKKGADAEKKRAKQQFEVRKALSIGGAVVSTIEGVINAITAKSAIPEPFGQILKYINAAAIGAAGLANIAKIAQTKFEAPATQTPDTGPDGSGGGGAGAPSMAGPSPTQIPQFTPAQFFNVGQQQGGGPNGQQPIQVVVTETDITQTQTRVRVIEDRATIG